MFQAPVAEIFSPGPKFSRSPKSLLKLPGGLQSHGARTVAWKHEEFLLVDCQAAGGETVGAGGV